MKAEPVTSRCIAGGLMLPCLLMLGACTPPQQRRAQMAATAKTCLAGHPSLTQANACMGQHGFKYPDISADKTDFADQWRIYKDCRGYWRQPMADTCAEAIVAIKDQRIKEWQVTGH